MGVIKLKNPFKHVNFSKEQDILSIFNYIYSKLGRNIATPFIRHRAITKSIYK